MNSAAGLPLPSLSRGRFIFSSNQQQGHIFAYTDDELFAQCGVRIAFTERTGGISNAPYDSLNLKFDIGDSDDAVAQNHAILSNAFHCSSSLFWPNQVHGTNLVQINSSMPDVWHAAFERAQEGCDAVLVSCEDTPALLCYADCLPLVLVAPTGSFVVAHCGWRGTVAHLAYQAAYALIEHAQCSASEINAYVGPYIHAECFRVGDDVVQQFSHEFGKSVLRDDNHVDLGAAIAIDLEKAGVDKLRIADVDMCTVCHSDVFYSYRASGGQTGRHAAFCVRSSR